MTGFEGNIISLNKILCASFVKIFEIFDDCLLVCVKMNNSNTNLYYVQFPKMMVVDFIHFFLSLDQYYDAKIFDSKKQSLVGIFNLEILS